MNKKILLPIVILTSLLLGFYLGHIKAKKSEMSISDMYIQKKNEVVQKEVEQYEFEGPLLTVNGKEFSFLDLPTTTQRTIIGESIEYRQRMADILKGFGVQYMVAITRNPNKEVNTAAFDDIVTFYGGIVTDKEVEEVYNKNLNVFPPGHDKSLTLSRIKVQMIVNKITEFTNTESSKYLASGQLVLNFKNPPIPSAWLKYELAPALKFSENPSLNVKILMNYSCAKCGNLQKELGELLEKYDPKKLEITLFHYSEKHLDISYYLNKVALCVREQNEDDFWKLNLELLGRTKEIALFKENDLDKAHSLMEEIFKADNFKGVSQKDVFDCVKKEDEKSKVSKYLMQLNSDFKYLSRLPMPILFINDVRINNESLTLLQAVNQFMR